MIFAEAEPAHVLHVGGMSIYHSKREIPLLWMRKVTGAPVLTVENYVKWYALFLIYPGDALAEIYFGRLSQTKYCRSGETPFCDHVPNPVVTRRFAEANGFYMDENALEMIIGRWELEYLEMNSRYYPKDAASYA